MSSFPLGGVFPHSIIRDNHTGEKHTLTEWITLRMKQFPRTTETDAREHIMKRIGEQTMTVTG